jgi:hypothetical protein
LLDCENLLLFGETLRAKDPNETRGKPSITRRSSYWKRERKKEDKRNRNTKTNITRQKNRNKKGNFEIRYVTFVRN